MDDESNSIAIVGMAGRFPGAASIDELWQNLCEGKESIRSFTAVELAAAGVTEATLSNPNFVNAGAPLKDADKFDASFFGYLPREAELMDPQHRIFLECAWHALEDAGCDPAQFAGDIGIFGSVARNTYYLQNAEVYRDLMNAGATYEATLGSDKDYPATRTAYQLNLKGPAMNIQTACSSSGVAIHLACQALLNGECDVALAGGARIQVPVSGGYLWTEGGVPSPDGHCRTFDANANGTVYGSGVAIVTLKRLEDALSDNDHIVSVIRASAINNDGNDKVGFTAPSLKGQAAVIETALAVAGIDPRTIGYVEAHGTGTRLGDPIEIAALSSAFRKSTNDTNFCAIGSLKTNLGHLDAGAGVAGIVKASLMLKHGMLVPSLNFEAPNPEIDFENSPFFVVTEKTRWPTSESPRRAGVSAFGMGGTNFHAVLEQAPDRKASQPAIGWQMFLQSARSEDSLDALSNSLAKYLEDHPDLNLADVGYTLACGRTALPLRRVSVADSVEVAARALGTRPTTLSRTVVDPADKILETAFVYSGQGSQYACMGRDLYDVEPAYREAIQRCLGELEDELKEQVVAALGLHDQSLDSKDAIHQTGLAQVCLFVTEYSLTELWRSKGVRPAAVAGHSIGEIVAACVAGVFSLEDAIRAVTLRGRLMQSMPGGAMLAVKLGETETRSRLFGALSIAALNGESLTVISGSADGIEEFAAQCSRDDVDCTHLRTSHAFHSISMEPAASELRKHLAELTLFPPQLPILSNVTGDWLTEADATSPDYWARHIVEPVRMHDCIGHLLGLSGHAIVEVGPGHTQCMFTRQHKNYVAGRTVVQSLRHPESRENDNAGFLLALGQLWCAGLELKWANVFPDPDSRNRVRLPGYAFQRTRYWLESATRGVTKSISAEHSDTSESPLPVDATAKSRPERIEAALSGVLHTLSGLSKDDLNPNTSFIELGFDSLFLTRANSEFRKLSDVDIGFRQLFDEAPTIRALAAHIDSQLPEDSPRFSNTNILASVDAPDAQQDHARANDGSYTTPFLDDPKSGPKPIGPWKPLSTGDFGELSEIQRTHLSMLISRLVAKTGKSKAYTAENREHLADPRAVAGFRRIWKEFVYPVVVNRSKGASVWDLDDNEYTDVAMGFGVSFLGHNHPEIIEAVKQQLDRGIEIGPQNPLAGEVAKLVCEFTGMQRAAFCNTGSEAVLAAIRMARTVSGKNRIVVFSGDYHGIFDDVLAKRIDSSNGSKSVPVAPGIPDWAVENTLVLEHGDVRSFETIREFADEIAGIVVEPVQSRHPDLQPKEYLKALQELANELDIALILDEVITGFRCHPGGIQALWGIEADIASYGKAVGGGFPIAVVAGKKKYMDALDGGQWQYGDDSFPEVGVTWFAGTFVRHPAALAASHAALTLMRREGPALQQELNRKTAEMVGELNTFFGSARAPIHIECFSSLFHIKFLDHADVASIFYIHLREKNIHISEGRMAFLSVAHSAAQIEHFKNAVKETVAEMHSGGFLPKHGDPIDSMPDDVLPGQVAMLPGQKEIWLAVSLDDDANRAFNLTNTMTLRGNLDQAALERSIADLVQRHEALRTTFDNNCTTQIIGSDSNVRLEQHDLRNLAEPDKTSRLQELQDSAALATFDLQSGPLFRPQLIRLKADLNILVLAVHHIVCDGWSSGVLMRELSRLYAHHCGKGVSLPTVVHQSRDLVELMASADYKKANKQSKAFWLDKLAGPLPVVDLPTDARRSDQRRFAAERIDRDIDNETIAQVRLLARESQSTFFTTLLAAYAAFLSRLCNQGDLIIGVSAAQQAARAMPNLVSHGVNMLPLRFFVNGGSSFKEFLQTARLEILDAFDHQACTYSELLPELSIDRNNGRPPLIAAVFNLDPSLLGIEMPDLEVSCFSTPRKFEAFDWFFNIVEKDAGARIECTYNRDLFAAHSMHRRIEEFVDFLQGLLASPEAAIGSIALVGESDNELIAKANATDRSFDLTQRCDQLISAALTSPEKIAVRFKDQEISYGKLEERSNQLANFLLDAGAKPGDLIGVYMARSLDLVVSLLGTMKAGCAYLPLDPMFPLSRVRYMLEDSGAKYLLTDEDLAGALQPFSGTIIIGGRANDDISGASTTPPAVPSSPDALAYVLYTSGSTGQPKGVMVTHRNLSNFLQAMALEPGLDSSHSLVAVTTTSFDISVLELFLPLTVGAELIVASVTQATDGELLRSLLERTGATHMQATPTTWKLLIQAEWSGGPRFHAYCGGEAMPSELARKLGQRCAELWNLYGPTETTIWSTCQKIEQGDTDIRIGTPIANTRIYVLNEQLVQQPVGVVGEIFIAGDGVSAGYLNRPELNQQAFLPDTFSQDPNARFYRTGDLGHWCIDGTLKHLGRMGGQVKIRGFRIELGEIESLLKLDDSVADAVCHVWNKSDSDQRLVANVVLAEGATLDAVAYRTLLRDRVPDYMVPQFFVSIDRIPLTANGKIDRASLGAPELDEPHVEVSEAPQSAAEQAIASIWKEVIGISQVGRFDAFFDVGGQSLLAVQVARRMEEDLGVRPNLRDLVLMDLSELAESYGDDLDRPVKTVTKPVRRSLFSRIFRKRA